MVFRSRDRLAAAAAAVEILRPGNEEIADRLMREARILADLAHPRIVAYLRVLRASHLRPHIRPAPLTPCVPSRGRPRFANLAGA